MTNNDNTKPLDGPDIHSDTHDHDEFGNRIDEHGETVDCCPVCGNPIDYCQGHDEIGDPDGYAQMRYHDEDISHVQCHPDGCEEARKPYNA